MVQCVSLRRGINMCRLLYNHHLIKENRSIKKRLVAVWVCAPWKSGKTSTIRVCGGRTPQEKVAGRPCAWVRAKPPIKSTPQLLHLSTFQIHGRRKQRRTTDGNKHGKTAPIKTHKKGHFVKLWSFVCGFMLLFCLQWEKFQFYITQYIQTKLSELKAFLLILCKRGPS